MKKLTSRLCAKTDHELCPDIPPGGELITVLPDGLFKNCEFYDFFGEKYYLGCFDLNDAMNFLDSKGYKLFVKLLNTSGLIYCNSDKKDKCKGIELVSKGYKVGSMSEIDTHWISGSVIDIVGIRFQQCAVTINLIKKTLKRKLEIVRRKEHMKRIIFFSALFLKKLKNLVSRSKKYKYIPIEQIDTDFGDAEDVLIEDGDAGNVPDKLAKLGFDEDVAGNIENDISDMDDDEDDEDSPDIDWVEEEVEICCKVPAHITGNNFNTMVALFKQFDKTDPDYNCLFNMLEISNSYLEIMHTSSNINQDAIQFIKDYIHFRHDVFSYLFTKEVIGVAAPFNDEKPIPDSDSLRTPDFYKIDSISKSIMIVEYTVVANRLRANFMKGIDLKSSKYSKEINTLQNKGWEVSYKPVFFSQTDELDSLISIWEGLGFSISENAMQLFAKYSNQLKMDYNYLFSFGFMTKLSRDFPAAEEKIESVPYVNDNWIVKIVRGNKRSFYAIINIVQNTVYEPQQHYQLIKTKARTYYMREIRNKTAESYTGYHLTSIKMDEGEIYNLFRKKMQGKEKCYVKTRIQPHDDLRVSTHGYKIEDSRSDSELTTVNRRNRNIFTMEESTIVDECLKQGSINGINIETNIASVERSLTVYKHDLLKKYDSKIANVAVQINPRRSFLSLIDSDMTADIQYTLGPTFRTLDPNRIQSTIAKTIYSRKNEMVYKESVELSPEAQRIKEIYKNKVSDYFTIIKNNSIDISNLKYKIAEKMCDNPQMLKEAKRNMIKAQRDYTNIIDKKGSKGIKLTQDELHQFKKETDWSSCRGYKLYKGKLNDINELVDAMKITARNIHLTLDLPKNDYDVSFFKSLKEQCLEDFTKGYETLKTTALFNNMVFLSRLAYTLMSLSNQTYNSKYIKIDNLGLTDVYLLVKGGKKITSTRKTKIFKLIYPAAEVLTKWNPSCFVSNNNLFDETPWMQLNQQQLFDMLAAPYKLLANFICLAEKYNFTDSLEMSCLPSLLLIHNRRKTEIILHNLRYLCVNPLSKYSQVDKMITDFAAPTYTAFDYAILNGLHVHYLDYFKTIRNWADMGSNDQITFLKCKIQHPFLNRFIKNIDDLVYTIYSTYMMTKGAYEQSLEQTINLKSIMETHSDYMSQGKSHIYSIRSSKDALSLKNDDFGFSYEACYNVGKFLSAELRNRNAATHLNIKWSNFLDDPIDNMASNKGMRYKGKDFFGHKGYYIVYKELLENDFNQIAEILKLESDILIHKELKKVNETFLTQQSKHELKQVVMHVVDKSQRGGHREIYVMDYFTKMYQAPIEKLFKTICEFIDNEIISVPSARRAGLIHKKCFEYRSEKFDTYYLTLDCRKWAPRSNPEKYFYMMLGMQDILPNDFLLAVTDYFIKHSNKKIKTRKEIAEKFFCNPDNNIYKKYFEYNEEESSAAFVMPYSFVMGIFNMLSSLLHAGGQIYAKYLLEKPFLLEQKHIDLDMFAHSDDSGGRLSLLKGTDPIVVQTLLGNYEYIMKSMNHLMSLKKCNVSSNYFELLSILYINHELLPLLPKFLSNINITFSGLGLSSDMKQIISKSIELQMNGATHSQAYKCQILLSNMYRNFYRVNHDTQIPALGGFANSWPPLYLCYGSSVDEVRSCMFNYPLYSRYVTFAIEHLDFELTDGTVSLKYQNVLRFPNAYKNLNKQIKLPEFDDNQWFFEQNKTRHSMLNLFWFKAKLNSPNFAVSLLNINEVKRAYDSLYMSKGSHIQGKAKLYSINELLMSIMNCTAKETEYEKVLRVMFQGLMRFYTYLEDSSKTFFTPKTQLTMKPCSLQINNFAESPIHDYHSLNLAVQLCRPELSKYTFSNKKYGLELNTMQRYLTKLGVPNDMILVKNFLDYMKKVDNTVINFYSTMPSNQRSGVSFNGLLNLIKCNFHSCLAINTDLSSYLETTTTMVEFNDKFKGLLLCLFFYLIAKESKNDDLMSVVISPKLTDGKRKLLSDAHNFVLNELPYPNSLAFLEMIENKDGQMINLSSFDNWAFWNKKQAKIGDEWIGNGEFTLSLDRVIMHVSINNREIVQIRHKQNELVKFSDFAMVFFFKLIEQMGLNFAHMITAEEGNSYLSLDDNNRLGLNKGNNAIVGVQQTNADYSLDFSWAERLVNHTYYNGRHYINRENINVRLMTVDDLVLHESKLDLFDIVDWESTTDDAKNVFFRHLTKGDYGPLPEISYVKDQLIESFLDTDIYKFFYNAKTNGHDVVEAFWNDILAHLNYSEDIFPTLYESLGLKDLESVLPKSKKDNLSLYLFYDNDNEELRTLRYQLRQLTDEEERLKYLSNIILTLGDEAGLVKLPEIGDPQEFKKFRYKELGTHNWINVMDSIGFGLFVGYQMLSDNLKLQLAKYTKRPFNNSDHLMDYLFGWIFRKEDFYYTNYMALTWEQITMHKLLEFIFSEKQSFAEFARSFRGTALQNVPRHPKYEYDWHLILSNLTKHLCCHPKSNYYDLLPASIIRTNKVSKLKYHDDGLTNYELSDLTTFAVAPMVYKTQVAIYCEPEDIRLKELDEAELGIFDFTKENAKAVLNSFKEYVDDVWEAEISYKKKKPGRKGYFIESHDHLQDYFNNEVSNENKCFVTNMVLPWLPAKKVAVYNHRGQQMDFFSYNAMDDNGNHYNQWKKADKHDYNKYIQYYISETITVHPYELNLDQKKIELNLTHKPDFKVIEERIDIESQDSYNSSLIDFLTTEFDLDENDKSRLTLITNKNKSAIGKFLEIKQYINNKKKESDENGIKIDKLLNLYFKDIGMLKKGMDLNPGIQVKTSLAKTSRNPDKILERITTYKAEFKQCNTLLDDYLGSILVENLVLSQGIVEQLQVNFRLLRMQFRQQKMSNQAATCNMLINILGSIKKGNLNSEGAQFHERMQDFLTLLGKSLLRFEDNDTDDDLEKPTHNFVEWKLGKKS
jgi:hypothetical protein